jgi:hypothetical protein
VPALPARARYGPGIAAAILITSMLLPPAAAYARQYAYAQVLQFLIFAVAGPALLVLGTPWRSRPQAWRPGSGGRRGGPGGRAAVRLVAFIAVVISWRLPVTVNALARNPALVAAEMVTLPARADQGLCVSCLHRAGQPVDADGPGHHRAELVPAELLTLQVGELPSEVSEFPAGPARRKAGRPQCPPWPRAAGIPEGGYVAASRVLVAAPACPWRVCVRQNELGHYSAADVLDQQYGAVPLRKRAEAGAGEGSGDPASAQAALLRHQRRAGRARTRQGADHDRWAPDPLPLPGRSPSAAPDTRREPGRALIASIGQRRASGKDPLLAFVFRPEPDAALGRVEAELRICAGPGFGDAERGPLADELQRPGGRQRPGPPPGYERVRAAGACERVPDRPRWFGIVVWPAATGSAGGLAAVGELQAEAEGAPGCGHVTRPAGQVLLGVAGAGPDPRGQEDLDPGGEG